MAIIFATPMLINGIDRNWKALPTLPGGVDPMRRVIVVATNTNANRANISFRVGTCTAGQAVETSGNMFTNGRIDLGVVDYNSITVRDNGNAGSNDTAYIYVMSFAVTDEGPRGVS